MSEKKNERSYETIYIIRADLTDEAEKKIQDKVTEVVGRFGGKIESAKDLMKRPLAYRIAKHTKGHYFQLNYEGTGQVVEELERHLRLTEDVIRFLTVRPALPPVPRPEKTQIAATPKGEGHEGRQEVSA